MNIKETLVLHLEEKAASLAKKHAERLVAPLYEIVKGPAIVVQQPGGGTIEITTSFLDSLKESVAAGALEAFQKQITDEFLGAVEKVTVKPETKKEKE